MTTVLSSVESGGREDRKRTSRERSWWPSLSFGWLEVLRVWETTAIRDRGEAFRHSVQAQHLHGRSASPSLQNERRVGKDDGGVIIRAESE